MRLSVATAAALAAAALCGGCGTPSADLFVVQRSGADRGANVRLRVIDNGSVRCNGGEEKAMGTDRLLTARQLARDLDRQAALEIVLPPGPRPGELRYRARLEAGSIGFSDTSQGRPAAFDRLAAFVTDVAERVCGIQR